MNKEFFVKQMELIAGAYRQDNFLSEGVLNTWYEFFKDIDPEVFEKNVRVWIKLNTKPPTIAELRNECRQDQHYV